MSLRPPAEWQVSTVPLHATRRRPRRPRSPKPPPEVIDILGHYGSRRLERFKYRGKPTLRYVLDEPSAQPTSPKFEDRVCGTRPGGRPSYFGG